MLHHPEMIALYTNHRPQQMKPRRIRATLTTRILPEGVNVLQRSRK